MPAFLARAGTRAVSRNDRARNAMLEAFVNLDLGRPGAAASAFAKIPNPDDGTLALAALFWGGDSLAGARAAARLSSDPRERSNGDGVFETQAAQLCVRTLWRLLNDEPVDVPDAARLLRATAADRDATWPPTRRQVCADVLEAFAAQRAGAPSAGGLIDALDRTLATRPYRILNWENLAAARLLEAQGEYARAAAAARRHIYYFGYTPYYSSHLRETGRLAALAGDAETAVEAYSRYLDLRQAPEPAVQAEVEGVREALARLTGERDGG